MIKQFLAALIFFCILLLQSFGLQRCANPFPPTGGERDSIPPMLVLEESTPNLQVNFRPEQIELTFDEWVVLANPSQIVISPPIQLEEQPRLKRRTLIIPLQGVELQDSVTYTINLGEAIVDLTERNPTENLRFVFATGPELDSAQLRGRVVDAYTGEPKQDILVSLYANLADTAVQTERPFYFAYTDEEGFYDLQNLRAGAYQAFALENAAGIYEFGNASSGVAFLDSLVEVSDTVVASTDFRLSPLPQRLRTSIDTSEFGLIKLGFNRPADEVTVESLRDDYFRFSERDSLRLFYLERAADSLFIGDEEMGRDTFYFSADSLEANLPRQVLEASKDPASRIYPGELAVIVFSRPLAAFDPEAIRIFIDSLESEEPPQISMDSMMTNQLAVKYPWVAGTSYRLELAPSAVTDVFGQQLSDSLSYGLRANALESVGSIQLNFPTLDSTSVYVVRLVSGTSKQLTTSFIIDRQAQFSKKIDRLQPGEYALEVIHDVNENGRYDGGNWELRRQPEKVETVELQDIRANWEVEAEVLLKVE
ncbi:MAG: Ig-like domain-containing protein [Bacteroidota bacterium]